ncbi:hypothetical protein ES288_A08G221200v1 [Gossypium darwinii]|uniref:Uncharacterized protein n=1 Tax=Gossypium darwinii TaxID=34276 RepID=A0A5D2FRU6_GOSDA|nr:hypothetical protein ES288_A08G221200v1 [Gossypium darwinii]
MLQMDLSQIMYKSICRGSLDGMLDRVVPRFLGSQNLRLGFTLVLIRVFVFLGLVILMLLIILMHLGLMLILLKSVPMMFVVIRIFRCRLVPRLSTLTQVLVIVSVVTRWLSVILLRIQDIKTKDTLLKGHIRDGLYHFSVSAVDSFVAHTKLQNKPVDALCLLCGIVDLVTLLVLLFIKFYKNVILLSISLVLMVYVLLVKKKSHISCPFLFQLLYINLLS